MSLTWVSVLALAFTAAPATTTRATASAPAPNAAVYYQQAFDLYSRLTVKERQIVYDFSDAPLDEEVGRLLQHSADALGLLHRGAGIHECAWPSVQTDEWPGASFPHLAKARNLARLAALRARWRFSRGDPAGAFDDLADAMALGRHVARGSLLVGFFVGIAIEDMARTWAADNLLGQDAKVPRAFEHRLAALPPAPTLRETVLSEKKAVLVWFRTAVAAAEKDRQLELLREWAGNEDLPRAVLDDTGGTKEGYERVLAAMGPFFDELAAFEPKSGPQFEAVLQDFNNRIEKAPPPTYACLHPLARAWSLYAADQMRRAMLRAAIAVVLNGPDALKTIKDPIDGDPFDYEALPDGGFRLTSKCVLVVPGKEFTTLTVGRTPKSETRPAGTRSTGGKG